MLKTWSYCWLFKKPFTLYTDIHAWCTQCDTWLPHRFGMKNIKKMKYSTSDGATVRRFPSATNNRNIFLACDTHTLIAHICNDNDQKKDGKPPLVDRSYAKHELSISSLHFFLSICLSFGFILDGVLQKRRVLRLRCIRCKKDWRRNASFECEYSRAEAKASATSRNLHFCIQTNHLQIDIQNIYIDLTRRTHIHTRIIYSTHFTNTK